MSIKVTIQPTTNIVSRVRQDKTAVSSINFGPKPSLSLGEITNVDASGASNNEVLVFDSVSNKFVVKDLQITANNLSSINGGIF